MIVQYRIGELRGEIQVSSLEDIERSWREYQEACKGQVAQVFDGWILSGSIVLKPESIKESGK